VCGAEQGFLQLLLGFHPASGHRPGSGPRVLPDQVR
jgi:hypothetical protein